MSKKNRDAKPGRAKKIYDVRNMLGLTQEQFAASLGVTKQWVSDLENGKGVPSDDLIRRLNRLSLSLDPDRIKEVLEMEDTVILPEKPAREPLCETHRTSKSEGTEGHVITRHSAVRYILSVKDPADGTQKEDILLFSRHLLLRYITCETEPLLPLGISFEDGAIRIDAIPLRDDEDSLKAFIGAKKGKDRKKVLEPELGYRFLYTQDDIEKARLFLWDNNARFPKKKAWGKTLKELPEMAWDGLTDGKYTAFVCEASCWIEGEGDTVYRCPVAYLDWKEMPDGNVEIGIACTDSMIGGGFITPMIRILMLMYPTCPFTSGTSSKNDPMLKAFGAADFEPDILRDSEGRESCFVDERAPHPIYGKSYSVYVQRTSLFSKYMRYLEEEEKKEKDRKGPKA